MQIGQEVIGHFEELFAELEGALRAFPDALWNRPGSQDDGDWNQPIAAPRFLAHHTVWCMSLEHLLRIEQRDLPHNIFPDYGPDKEMTRQQVLDILADVRAYARSHYAQMPEEDYLRQDEKGQSPLGRMMYALAHTRHHYGQLVQILRDSGIEPPDWYPI